MTNKILFVLTNHTQLGDTGRTTGFHLLEMADPYVYLKDKGHDITFISPKGGEVVVDKYDETNPKHVQLMKDDKLTHKLKTTLKIESVSAEDYDGIYLVGGHGTMWDFADNEALEKLIANLYESNKIVSGVCHGPAGLVNVKLNTGAYLVSGKHLTAFSDDEERAVKLETVVPFLLETKLVENGALYEKSPLWQKKVVQDDNLVTGQNPASALDVAKAIDGILQKK